MKRSWAKRENPDSRIMMGSLDNKIPPEVTEAVGESLKLLQNARFGQAARNPEHSLPLPSLLERCEELIERQEEPTQEPVRLIHHFACTGGTLITKCLACSPNVQALSEVDPLSPAMPAKSQFNPTDIIRLLEYGSRGASIADKLAMFRASFRVLHESSALKGLRMLVRDHAHSHFCRGETIPERPTLSQIMAEDFQTRSILTVRHPLESWISLNRNKWVHFRPVTLEEYARRYLSFLAAYPETPIFKYEEFTVNPDQILREMCSELRLPFQADYKDHFMAHRFSGDSGRTGSLICRRSRLPVSSSFMQAAKGSFYFRAICERLQYEI